MGNFTRPISPEEMSIVERIIDEKFSDKINTICDHVRIVYKLSDSVEQVGIRKILKDECKTIMVYAKRMDSKLKRYSCNKEYEI